MTTSTIEAELLGMLHAGKQIRWWIRLFEKLNFNPGHQITLYGDNLQPIRIPTSEMAKTNTQIETHRRRPAMAEARGPGGPYRRLTISLQLVWWLTE